MSFQKERQNSMTKKLNPTEAVFGFAAWLTTRHEVTRMGATEDAAPIADMILEFVEANNLVMPCERKAEE
jgi:hypothetical protein